MYFRRTEKIEESDLSTLLEDPSWQWIGVKPEENVVHHIFSSTIALHFPISSIRSISS